MKKKFVLFALLGIVALTSCGSKQKIRKPNFTGFGGTDTEFIYENWEEGKTFEAAEVNVVVNYRKTAGPTYRQANPYLNLDGKVYTEGDLLPTWRYFGEQLNLTINDVDDYTQSADNAVYDNYTKGKNAADAFTTKDGKFVDLFSNTTANMQKAAKAGLLEPLNNHYDEMPHYKKWLDANPTTAKQLLVDGNIYFSPYFDGKDTIEKLFMMNTEYVAKLLDDEYDSANFDTNLNMTIVYNEPYIAELDNEPILVTDRKGELKEITVTIKKGEDIISRMNSLEKKDGVNLRNCLKQYLKDTYGAYIGAKKLYDNYSEIYTSAKACYNADELIALMRVVRANSKYLTGTDDKIETFVPRSGEANRQRNVLCFEQIWGIRGTDSERDRLFFDKDGKLHDGRTEEATYDGIEKLNKLYQEGLILENYYTGFGDYYKGLWNSNLIKSGHQFMCYDYSATTVSYDSSTLGEESKTNGFMPVLPPYAKWDSGLEYEYIRFSEDNRALKAGGWCVPKNAKNKSAAYRLLDYLFTLDGIYAQDFGPKEYKDGTKTNFWTETITLADGTVCPKISAKVLAAINAATDNSEAKNANAAAGNWNNWYRYYVGATLGVGHIRSNGLDYQVNGPSGQTGLSNVKAAIKAGSLALAQTNGSNFFRSVLSNWDIDSASTDNINTETKDLAALFTEANPKSGAGSCQPYSELIIKGFGTETTKSREEITALFEKANKSYLETYQKYIENFDE